MRRRGDSNLPSPAHWSLCAATARRTHGCSVRACGAHTFVVSAPLNYRSLANRKWSFDIARPHFQHRDHPRLPFRTQQPGVSHRCSRGECGPWQLPIHTGNAIFLASVEAQGERQREAESQDQRQTNATAQLRGEGNRGRGRRLRWTFIAAT